ncbi:probable mitochondrial glutathione transporter SLC25A40 isoform X2 [Mercenaria mercenaria]|nr:probable mitochondrial glutathione transporter SLC25A40 isoform X2 [Mercenaria mercenaria]
MDHTCVCLNGNTVNLSVNAKSWQKNWYKRPGNFNGMFDALYRIGRNEGITSLWSGLPPTLVMAVPATVVYFTSYDQIKTALSHSYNIPVHTWWIPVVSGSSARVFAATVISPLELIRTKMQSEQLTYRQVREAVRTTIQQDGSLSLWRGLAPTLLRDVPFSALYWLSYEMMKAKVMKDGQSTKLSFVESFVSGACAGTLAGIVTLPFDVIKTHRQIELGEVVFAKEKKEVSSTWKLIQNLYRQQGIKALFTGLAPRVMKVAPACAIMISTYEHCKLFFRQRNLELQENR